MSQAERKPAQPRGIPTAPVAEPQQHISEEQLLQHLLHLETRDVNLEFVFDHIRNYGICGAMLWIGGKVLAQAHNGTDLFGMTMEMLAGATLFALPWLLFALNFGHGVIAVSKLQDLSKISKVAYVLVSLLIFIAASKLMYFAKGA